jgi:hypothetical protein
MPDKNGSFLDNFFNQLLPFHAGTFMRKMPFFRQRHLLVLRYAALIIHTA